MRPSGAFVPWVVHTVRGGRCVTCGIAVPAVARCSDDPQVTWSHYGRFLNTKPLGNICPCTG